MTSAQAHNSAAQADLPTASMTGAPLPSYSDRLSKAQAVAARFAPLLVGDVLDVGCDRAPLRQLVPEPARYVGLDGLSDDAEVRFDLDSNSPLPFGDRSFDAVLCTDVLEHLERCCSVFDELCRVSRRWVIVSLPNPLRTLLDAIQAGQLAGWKHYGLPTTPPRDRHRWFFSAADAERFVREGAARNRFAVRELFFESVGAYRWLDETGRNLLDDPAVTRGTLWTALERLERD